MVTHSFLVYLISYPSTIKALPGVGDTVASVPNAFWCTKRTKKLYGILKIPTFYRNYKKTPLTCFEEDL